jgi:hypothetical protein
MTRLDEIEARLAKATPGPWAAREARDEWTAHDVIATDEAGRPKARLVIAMGGWDTVYPDLTFIAHARADIPYLIAQVRERDAAIAEKCAGCQGGIAADNPLRATWCDPCPLYLYRKGE